MIGEQRHSARVLIVEDEPRMRELLLRAVGSWGWEVSAARTGEEALRAMEAEARQIVLLDLNLPGMGGLDCLEQMRRQWAETQVVILTGFGDLEAARRAIHLDVVEFLTKPCHLGELEQAMDRARRRLEDCEEEVEEMEVAPPPPAEETGQKTLAQTEREQILATLARNQGNRTVTAADLGISLRTLYYRLSEYQSQGYRIDE